MKKWFNIILLFVLVFSLAIVISPQNVQAKNSNESRLRVASGGNWNYGKEFEVMLDQTPSPYTWLELISQGVKVKSDGTLCHPFRGHFYNWKANIYKLVDGSWEKVKTTFGYESNTESNYVACTKAKAGNTYALFGYYDESSE
jgi:hypothetical protein